VSGGWRCEGSAKWREVVENAATNIVKYTAIENIEEIAFTTD
jgi:hypothetical protein